MGAAPCTLLISFRYSRSTQNFEEPSGNRPRAQDQVEPTRAREGVEVPRDFSDYEVTVDTGRVPEGVSVKEA